MKEASQVDIKGNDASMKYFKIKNWDKYQHTDAARSKHGMAWVKSYSSIIYDVKVRTLDTHSRLFWLLLLPFAGQQLNVIHHDADTLKSIMGLKKKPNLALFEELGLIEVFDASNMPATCQHREEKRRERRGEEIRNLQAEDKTLSLPNLTKIWNENRGPLPEILDTTKKRLALWRSRWAEKPDEAYWVDIIRKITESPFCCGDNDRGWTASVDFMLRPDTHIKVLENKYQSKGNKHESKNTSIAGSLR